MFALVTVAVAVDVDVVMVVMVVVAVAAVDAAALLSVLSLVDTDCAGVECAWVVVQMLVWIRFLSSRDVSLGVFAVICNGWRPLSN